MVAAVSVLEHKGEHYNEHSRVSVGKQQRWSMMVLDHNSVGTQCRNTILAAAITSLVLVLCKVTEHNSSLLTWLRQQVIILLNGSTSVSQKGGLVGSEGLKILE